MMKLLEKLIIFADNIIYKRKCIFAFLNINSEMENSVN